MYQRALTWLAPLFLLSTVLLGVYSYELRLEVLVSKLEEQKAKTEVERIGKEHATLVAKHAKDTIDFAIKSEALSKEAQNARNKEMSASKRLELASLEYNHRMRALAEDYAAPGGDPGKASDTITACRDRASTLASLLAEAMQVAAESTGAAEQCGTDLRAVLKASQ